MAGRARVALVVPEYQDNLARDPAGNRETWSACEVIFEAQDEAGTQVG